jgi:hypothetical protein
LAVSPFHEQPLAPIFPDYDQGSFGELEMRGGVGDRCKPRVGIGGYDNCGGSSSVANDFIT